MDKSKTRIETLIIFIMEPTNSVTSQVVVLKDGGALVTKVITKNMFLF